MKGREKNMKHPLVFMCLVLFLFVIEHGNASEYDYEKIQFVDSQQKFEYDIRGCFSKPCVVPPGNSLFVMLVSDSQCYLGFNYDFTGRTGEKTFDIKFHRSSKDKSFEKNTDMHVYYVQNDKIPLQSAEGMYDCSNKDNIFLKLLDLSGNTLKFQIELPECIKK
jgi:hypothetical protein